VRRGRANLKTVNCSDHGQSDDGNGSRAGGNGDDKVEEVDAGSREDLRQEARGGKHQPRLDVTQEGREMFD
jgi:hypothetical protein